MTALAKEIGTVVINSRTEKGFDGVSCGWVGRRGEPGQGQGLGHHDGFAPGELGKVRAGA